MSAGKGRSTGPRSRADEIRREADRLTEAERALLIKEQHALIKARLIEKTGRRDGLEARTIRRALNDPELPRRTTKRELRDLLQELLDDPDSNIVIDGGEF
jgi:regulator of protease activity HflC (stomatin/prohibitin superfamily)